MRLSRDPNDSNLRADRNNPIELSGRQRHTLVKGNLSSTQLAKLISALTAILMGASANAATVFTETADVGELIGTAQVLVAGTTLVNGYLDENPGDDADPLTDPLSSLDRDLYQFSWAGGNIRLQTGPADFDTQLYLFDGTGTIVGANNDDGLTSRSRLSLLEGLLAAGTYYVGVTAYNNDPYNSLGEDIEDPLDDDFTTMRPGVCAASSLVTNGDCVLDSWAIDIWGNNPDTGGFGAYSLSIISVVPLPAAAWPFGSALGLLGWIRRRGA